MNDIKWESMKTIFLIIAFLLAVSGLVVRVLGSEVWMSGLIETMLEEYNEHPVKKGSIPPIPVLEIIDFFLSIISIFVLLIGLFIFLFKKQVRYLILIVLASVFVVHWASVVAWQANHEANYFFHWWTVSKATDTRWIFLIQEILYPLGLVVAAVLLLDKSFAVRSQ